MKYELRYGAWDETQIASSPSETRFTALKDSENAAYWVDITLRAPVADTYVMIPACAYNGNRFEAVARNYPPMFTENELGDNVPVRITQVPRLSPRGDSFMDVTTGDMAAPCVCVFNRKSREGFMVFFDQCAHGLNHGVSLDQRGDMLAIRLRAPAKRRLVYRWYDGMPSLRENTDADAPLHVLRGDETAISHRIFTFHCADIQELYREFFEKRSLLFHAGAHVNLPFSAFRDMTEEQLNQNHFMENAGFYALSARDGRDKSRFGVWQAGWVGGGMITLPLICDGAALSRSRAIRTLEFAAAHQSAAGWYYGIVDADGKVYHDCFLRHGDALSLILVRKHADLTYFMFKQLAALERLGIEYPSSIRKSAVRAADALAALWEKHGQPGQFINAETGEIVVGGSTSGAIAPAALCAAAEITGNARYASIAIEIGEYFYENATAAGITTGGPGEILQAPDSESAAALLESYMALYELGAGDIWLSRARDAAHQVASWVVPYDYEFPKKSRFARMGVRSAGSVWANVQNKHSAPGMCTLSPAMLLKLFRAAGDEKYLELMRQIAHFPPQVVSYPQRPMYSSAGGALRPGEMCERVNMSDWEGNEGVGDSIFGASSWPQAAMMLTWLEVPGVYVMPSRGIVCASDHVNAAIDGDRLRIHNPTGFSARVKLMLDDEESVSQKLGLFWQDRFRIISVPAGGSIEVAL